MFKHTLSLLFLFWGCIQSYATGFPIVGTDAEPQWYFLQFMNGGSVISASSQGEVQVSIPKNSPDQLWRLEGNDTEGYTFINKKGLTLCLNSNAKKEKLKAQSTASGVYRFLIKPTLLPAYIGGFEIHPKNNSSVALNLWGGPGADRGVGLWDKKDPNNPIVFIGTSDSDIEKARRISIVPYPSKLTIKKEGELSFKLLNSITYPDEETRTHVEDFARQLNTTSGIQLSVKPTGTTPETAQIHLAIDNEEPAEGYTLRVNENGIEIKASAKAGFFYALQTLKQLLPRAYFANVLNSDAEWSVPFVDIDDEPELGYRGFMLDVARHFFTKEEVKRVLDVMALYKMNRFHWHLTEDQGWRIEIPKYPRLTEVGAIRAGSYSNPGEGERFYDDTEYGRGMFYTKADLQEVVAYAKERNIEIIPEVDLPGHMVAAIAAYPEFSCNPSKKHEVRIEAGISHDVLNIGDDKVIEFLKDVMDFLSEVFPYQYVHLGGDECPTEQWQANAQCLKRVKQHNLKGVEELQAWLVDHLGTYLKEKHGKDVMVWDEVILHWNKKFGLKPIVMAWNIAPDPGGKYTDRSPAKVAADLGLKSIYVPWNKLYLDWMQTSVKDALIDEPYHGGWGDGSVTTVKTVYDTNPVGELSGREHFGMGVQGNLWTETTNDAKEMEYQILPRLLALSEVGWLPASKKNWASFYQRLQRQDEIIDALGYTYAKHLIEPQEYTPAEQSLHEAREILKESRRGGVGYPSTEVYDALKAACEAAEASAEKTQELNAALESYKTAHIMQPQPERLYQIVSASTYYKRQFKGSTVYEKNNELRFHYTPQVEPEELWSFEPATGGFVLKNFHTGRVLRMPTYGKNVTTATANGTVIRVDKATVPTRNYNYIPGVVTISEAQGYSPLSNQRTKRLNATLAGTVNAADSVALCYTGTWLIVEVEDFKTQLQGILNKSERILATAQIGETGQPTREALDFLKNHVCQPAETALKNTTVSRETYIELADKYKEFQLMEKTSFLQSIDETHYYRLRNVWFNGQYATANPATLKVDSKTDNAQDNQLWQIVKNQNGTREIISKINRKATYIEESSEGATIRLGKPYGWLLEERTLDNKTGICIIDKKRSYSWYTNPGSWEEVIIKPFWGACTWVFEKTNITVVSAIDKVQTDETPTHYFDLSGRMILQPSKGLYITPQGKKVMFE